MLFRVSTPMYFASPFVYAAAIHRRARAYVGVPGRPARGIIQKMGSDGIPNYFNGSILLMLVKLGENRDSFGIEPCRDWRSMSKKYDNLKMKCETIGERADL
eukprot:GHVU01104447.1.p2 GENE.GHVU01104447.1~~GHVU01104447.1.p2  ORF type:complete len:102 (-),score=4.01 GHVU01104447.1:1312-1617(-)